MAEAIEVELEVDDHDLEDDFADVTDVSDDSEVDDDSAEDEDDSSDDDTDESESDSEEEPQSDEAKQKAINKEMAERRIAEKARAEADRAQQEAELRQQQAEYVAEADVDDPRDLAVRQLQVDAYNNKIATNTNSLTSAYERAIRDFEVLRDESPAVQSRLNRAIDLFQAGNVVVDQYGNPTEVKADLYSYLQIEADSISELTGLGAHKQTDAKGKEKSKATMIPSRAPKSPKKNPALDGFDEEASS